MKYKFGKTEREYNPKMMVSEFILANDGPVGENYIKSYPNKAYKVNDGDLDEAIEYAYTNKEYYKEIMQELYIVYLDNNE